MDYCACPTPRTGGLPYLVYVPGEGMVPGCKRCHKPLPEQD